MKVLEVAKSLPLDLQLIILGALVFAALGYFTGFVSEVFSALGLLAALFLALPATQLLFTRAPIMASAENKAISVAVVGTLFYFLVTRFGRRWYRQNVRGKKAITVVDRILGVAVGFLKGGIIALWLLQFGAPFR